MAKSLPTLHSIEPIIQEFINIKDQPITTLTFHAAIALEKITAGTRGCADNYGIQLARPLYCPVNEAVSNLTVLYEVEVSDYIGLQ